jgi:hypothetical protein
MWLIMWKGWLMRMTDELPEETASDARTALGVPRVLMAKLCWVGTLVVGECFLAYLWT